MQKDITANRHRGNKHSREAFERIAYFLPTSRRRVYAAIHGRPRRGLTARECAESFGVTINVVSGRFSELKRDNLIKEIGRRDGCAVYVVK